MTREHNADDLSSMLNAQSEAVELEEFLHRAAELASSEDFIAIAQHLMAHTKLDWKGELTRAFPNTSLESLTTAFNMWYVSAKEREDNGKIR